MKSRLLGQAKGALGVMPGYSFPRAVGIFDLWWFCLEGLYPLQCLCWCLLQEPLAYTLCYSSHCPGYCLGCLMQEKDSLKMALTADKVIGPQTCSPEEGRF